MRARFQMPRPIVSLALAVFIALPVSATAESASTDPQREARLTVAQAYVDASIADLDVAAMVRTMYKPLLDQARASGREVSAAQEAEIDALFQQNMAGPLVEIMEGQVEIMADLFTLTQIEDLYAFYMTPSGRAVMQKLPQLAEAQMPLISELVGERMQEMLPEIMDILEIEN